MADRVGQQLGKYRLTRLLGQGGSGDVYLGEHIYLRTQAAIKVLNTKVTGDDVEKFLTEARTVAHLKHSNIVRVLDSGIEDVAPYLVMDYAPKGTLRERHPKGYRVPLPDILSYVKQIAAALQYAHDQKLIHRDVKPGNMLVGADDEILLSDFGIAVVAHTTDSQSLQNIAGTASYMAPEQLTGKPSPASDQYALGVVVYEWLCGEPPFQGSLTEVAMRHITGAPIPPRQLFPDISPAVEMVVLTALAKEPQLRFASVQAFANALGQACQSPLSTSSLIVDIQQPPGYTGRSLYSATTEPQPPIAPTASEAISNVPTMPLLPVVQQETNIPTFISPSQGRQRPASSKLEKCPFCLAETRAGDNFCLNCGNRLLIPTTPESAATQVQPGTGDATGKGPHWGTSLLASGFLPTIAPSSTESAEADIVIELDGNIIGTYQLNKTVLTVGSLASNDIQIPSPHVSRLHAKIVWENTAWVIQDVDSLNGLYFNAQRIDQHTLANGDCIYLTPTIVLRYKQKSGRIEQPPPAPPPLLTPEQIRTPREASERAADLFATVFDGPPSPVSPPPVAEPVPAVSLPTVPPSQAVEVIRTHHDTERIKEQWMEKGDVHYKMGQHADALAAYEQVIQLDAQHAQAYFCKGNALQGLGRLKEALAAYNDALKSGLDNAAIWNAKGGLLYKLKDHNLSLDAYDHALTFTPDDAGIWITKGNILRNLKRYEEALVAYERVLQLTPHNVDIWVVKGTVLYRLERYELALDAYIHASRFSYRRTAIWTAKGEVLYKLERYDEALVAYERAHALKPNDPSIANKCELLRKLIQQEKWQREEELRQQEGLRRQEEERLRQEEQQREEALRRQEEERQRQEALRQQRERFAASRIIQPGQARDTQEPQPAHEPDDEATRVVANDGMPPAQFDVYLIYSKADATWVENLAGRLEDEHGIKVWLDKWMLIPGESEQHSRAQGIDQANCFAVCIGKQTPSEWFKREIELAQNRRKNNKALRVIPVLLPNAKNINIDDFLELNNAVDFRTADQGYAFYMLVCGIQGKSPGRGPRERTLEPDRTITVVKEMLVDLQDLPIDKEVAIQMQRTVLEKVWLPNWLMQLDATQGGYL